jgi:hypothetical protein
MEANVMSKKEVLGKQTVSSLIKMIKMELAKYAKVTALDTVKNDLENLDLVCLGMNSDIQDLQTKTATMVGKKNPTGGGEIFNDYVDNKAPGGKSSARNYQNQAHADCSDVSGHGNKVYGYAGHGQNRAVVVNGYAADAGGEGTVANGLTQSARGSYNLIDTTAPDPQPDYSSRKKGKYLEIIGNGSSTKRSNARTTDWEGNGWYAGNVNATDFVLENGDDRLSVMNNLGHDIKVIRPTEAGTMILQENCYYQFVGSEHKKVLRAYNSDNSVAKTMEFQVLTIQCGSMTDNAEYGIVEDIPTAWLYVIGNDTGLSALTGADTAAFGFKKNYKDGTPNTTFRVEVDYPAGSTIIIYKKNK